MTPTGAALVRVLSAGAPPREYVPVASGFGAGTRDFKGRANALRIVLADVERGPAGERGQEVRGLVQLACDVDDLAGEYAAAAAERLREHGALDVVLIPTLMKRGRPGVRIEVLAAPAAADRLADLLMLESTSIGVRRSMVERQALPRETRQVLVLGHEVGVKVVTLPDGRRRAKPEFADVERVALATGQPMVDIFRLALGEAETP